MEPEKVLIGEVIIGFTRILKEEIAKMNRKDSEILNSQLGNFEFPEEMEEAKSSSITKENVSRAIKRVKDKLWLYGKHVGRLNGIIEVRDCPQLKQMSVGVLMNNGVSLSSLDIAM